MIISVHIRKNAGQSFRAALKEHYGDRLFLDYGDLVGSTSSGSKLVRLKRRFFAYKNRRRILDRYDVIHGHFYASKYRRFAKDLQYATILRDPVDRVLSNYYYIMRKPGLRHPNARTVRKRNMSLEEYARYPDSRNLQSRSLRGVPISDFAFVGICEDYPNSVRLFNATFGSELKADDAENTNPRRSGSHYAVDDRVAALIRDLNHEDCRLYERGVRIFRESLQRHGWSASRLA